MAVTRGTGSAKKKVATAVVAAAEVVVATAGNTVALSA